MIQLYLEIIFGLGIVSSLLNVVDGLKPDSWSNRHYRQVEAINVLSGIALLFVVVLYY